MKEWLARVRTPGSSTEAPQPMAVDWRGVVREYEEQRKEKQSLSRVV